MAFLLYFFVLLAVGTSVLFGLDWANAPLKAPASQTHVAASTARARAERVPPQKPLAAVPIGRPETSEPVAPRPEPEPVVQQQPPPVTNPPPEQTAASPNRVNVERATVGAAPETSQPEPQRHLQRHPASEASARERSESRRHAHRRKAKEWAEERVPAWAIRGAEAAQRDAEDERRSGAPPWAIRGAEAAQRESARGARASAPFVPFWEPNEGWHLR